MPKVAHNILVTGGAGYIGSVLVPMLLKGYYNVTVIDNLMYKQTSLFSCCNYDNFNFVKGDVRDRTLMNMHLAKADIVIPLAAIVGAPACNKDVNLASEVNWDSFYMLRQSLSRDQLVLYPNTNSGYGIGDKDEYCTEESPLNPISSYGRHKVLVEKLLLERDNTIVFRFATVFGISPRMRLDLLVNDFVYKAVTDGYIFLYEDHFRRNYIHIQDVARVFFQGIALWYQGARSEVYNVGLSEANYTKKELCTQIKQHLPDLYIHTADIGNDPDKRDYYVSNKKLEKTGWKCKFNLDMGIKELVKGYKMMGKDYSNV